ncbi:MAG: molybdopterin-dependent oxidoreductase [Thermoflexales bacterium]|nr:molybdopterin-dependent oxidoreductase [Thermoflexales bacterium]MDW8351601.1 molybdopterin-dependent oxidoreductase [Anaerolineae bacterium]
MRPRLVDWTLFVLAGLVAASGFGAWLLLDAQAAPVIAIHAAAGLAILVPLAWKFRRVRPRITRASAWDWRTPLSLFTAIAAIGSVATGVFWTHAQAPTGYPNGMHLHIVFGIALIVSIVLHVTLRFKLPSRRDLQGRRDALRWLGMLGFGALLLPAQHVANHALNLPGAQRRFTGSRGAGDDTGPAMPITNWMFDRPAPIDVTTWRLTVRGAVERPLTLTIDDLQRDDWTTTLRATLDCTGGWHSTQDWRGVRVGNLLDRAGVRPAARFVSFVSVTGYRWSLPLDEAREALLATHYEDVPLEHWHGAPLRLVAPGRRGFMWVKWVGEVVVLAEPDPGQWIAIFTSGLSG